MGQRAAINYKDAQRSLHGADDTGDDIEISVSAVVDFLGAAGSSKVNAVLFLTAYPVELSICASALVAGVYPVNSLIIQARVR